MAAAVHREDSASVARGGLLANGAQVGGGVPPAGLAPEVNAAIQLLLQTLMGAGAAPNLNTVAGQQGAERMAPGPDSILAAQLGAAPASRGPVIADHVVEPRRQYRQPQPDKWLAEFRKTGVPNFAGTQGSDVEQWLRRVKSALEPDKWLAEFRKTGVPNAAPTEELKIATFLKWLQPHLRAYVSGLRLATMGEV